jgi:hypothetical protein
MKIIPTTVLLSCLFSCAAGAQNVDQYVGYRVVAKKTIVGYVDKDGTGDKSFKGCNFGRKIVFDDNTYLTCTSYGYQYAYRPEAVILVRDGSWKMLVENESYEMQN